jgi:hypothetical protein
LLFEVTDNAREHAMYDCDWMCINDRPGMFQNVKRAKVKLLPTLADRSQNGF